MAESLEGWTGAGRFVWHDLLTTDPDGAGAFYTDVIGWRVVPEEGTPFRLWMAGDREVGALMDLPAGARRDHDPGTRSAA